MHQLVKKTLITLEMCWIWGYFCMFSMGLFLYVQYGAVFVYTAWGCFCMYSMVLFLYVQYGTVFCMYSMGLFLYVQYGAVFAPEPVWRIEKFVLPVGNWTKIPQFLTRNLGNTSSELFRPPLLLSVLQFTVCWSVAASYGKWILCSSGAGCDRGIVSMQGFGRRYQWFVQRKYLVFAGKRRDNY